MIHLHGGPEEQERPIFSPLYHELTGRGLDVFAPDVRGSSGHGRSFVDADLGTGRFAALDDVADCAAHAVAAGPADPTRLAVMGRSYGGYLTFASLVHHPDLFRTGVAVCGMSDFATFFAGTEPWLAESAAHKYGHPERDRELLRALSPMTRIDALRVPCSPSTANTTPTCRRGVRAVRTGGPRPRHPGGAAHPARRRPRLPARGQPAAVPPGRRGLAATPPDRLTRLLTVPCR